MQIDDISEAATSTAASRADVKAAMLGSFLADRDVACPGCGYNVRDLRTDTCPECGQRFVLSLRLGEPRQAAMIAGLVGLSAGAGLGGLLLIYALIVVFVLRRGPGGLDRFLVINSIGFIVHAAAIAAWVWQWNRIRRLDAHRRWSLVVICIALPIAFVVTFAFNVR